MVKKQIMTLLSAILPILLHGMETWRDPVTGITWRFTLENGEASLGGKIGTAAVLSAVWQSTVGDLKIPNELDGYPVTSVGEGAFLTCDKITSISIPQSVRNIDRWAFEGCDSMTSIYMR